MLQNSIDWLFYSLIGLDSGNHLIASLNYFVYDSIKIFMLLFIMIFIIGFLRSYVPSSRIKKIVSKAKFGTGNILAAFFGTLTPFCSCSTIPLFLSFVRMGLPIGVTFSYLITSPLVNEYLVVLMLGYFGWKITVLYVLFGVLIGSVSGAVLARMNVEKYIDKEMKAEGCAEIEDYPNIMSRVRFGLDEAVKIVKKLWAWILVGVGIGALIHNYVPQELIQAVMEKGGIFVIPIVVLFGVPIYGSCAAILPIANALFLKGVPLGTALAFMMAVSALSLPEAIILRRAMKLKLIAIFFGIVIIGIIIIGYLFNFLQFFLI